jgi:flagellar biosynthesis/type III secretory pathway M-ring protein FliF/YscJ
MEKIGPGVRDTGKIVAIIAICLFAFLFVLRPMVRRTLALSQTEVTVSGPTQLSAAHGGGKASNALPRTIAEVESEIENQLDAAAAEHLADRRMPVLQRRVVSMAQAEPQNAARLVRSWLAEERN